MKLPLRLALPIIAASLAAPASAAQGLDCVYEGLDAATREAVVTIYAGDGAGGDTINARIAQATRACAPRFRWPETAARVASNYAVARIIHEHHLLTSPLDADQLRRADAMLDAVDAQTAARWWSGGMTATDGQDFAARMRAAQLPLEQPIARFLGQYGAVRYQMQQMRAYFATL
jgi:hypothetical protein